jgi:hypothetical protein
VGQDSNPDILKTVRIGILTHEDRGWIPVMSRWFRVFGTTNVQPEPARLLEEARALAGEVSGRFRGDDLGWFRADLVVAGTETPLSLERYLASEEGIRAELNTWAAWLEETSLPQAVRLMQHMVSTAQVFTLSVLDPDAEALDSLCIGLCRFLARETTGIYQIDGQGFFAADGALLVPEDGEQPGEGAPVP